MPAIKCFYCGGDHSAKDCPGLISRSDKLERGEFAIQELGYKTKEEVTEIADQYDLDPERMEDSEPKFEVFSTEDGFQDFSVEQIAETALATIHQSKPEQIKKAPEDEKMEGDLAKAAKEAMLSFAETFTWAHSNMMWQSEKQIALLTGIRDILSQPRATEANELFGMACEAFQVNRFQEAIKLLENARVKNPVDYRIHLTLGHIHVMLDELPEAAECFGKASDYGRDNKYKSEAYMLLGRTYWCMGEIDNAIDAINQAVNVTPENNEMRYFLATCKTMALTR